MYMTHYHVFNLEYMEKNVIFKGGWVGTVYLNKKNN